MLQRIYIDNSATTPVDPRVLEAMLPFLKEDFGNASSIHYFGQRARSAVDKARHQVAAALGARPNEIVFTSGGTESNNLAIRGLIDSHRTRQGHDRVHIISSTIEHPAVKNVIEDLEKQGIVSVSWLPVYENGVVLVEDVKNAILPETLLISIMHANNEIGTIQPVVEIGRLVHELRAAGQKIWFHTDAVQAFGKVPVNVEDIGCDLLSISAHKVYAPKGVGAVYVRRGTRLHPQNLGGRQERGIRGGTEAVPTIVAMGAAAEIVQEQLNTESVRLRKLRDRFEDGLAERIEDFELNGDRQIRLPNISNVSFRRIEGEGLLINLDMQGIAVSTGSACSSGSLEPSPVIRALGRNDELARGAIRFSFGRMNNECEIDRLLEQLPKSINALRQLAPRTRNAK